MFTFLTLVDQPDVQSVSVGIDAKSFRVSVICFHTAAGAVSDNGKGFLWYNFIFYFLYIAYGISLYLHFDAQAITGFIFICNSRAMQSKRVLS